VRQWAKFGVLLAVMAILAVAARMWFQPSVRLEKHAVNDGMQANQFRYTELINGVPVYHLSGQQMHDEAGKLGDMRVAVLRVVKIEKVQLALLQPKVAGWVLTAAHGELISGNRKLSLWGSVRGERKGGGTLQAGRLLVDPRRGKVQLQGGFVLDVGQRHERGIATELN